MKQGGASPRPTGVRPAAKSGVRSSGLNQGLSGAALGEMYGDLQQRITELRKRKLDQKAAEIESLRRAAPPALRRSSAVRGRSGAAPRFSAGTVKSMLLFGAILALGAAKISLGAKSAEQSAASPSTGSRLGMLALPNTGPAENEQNGLIPKLPEPALPSINAPVEAKQQPALMAAVDRRPGNWSESEKQLLLELDTRRVELEKRREGLDQREAELRNQAQALADRLAELKSLTARLGQVRKEKSQQYDARMEQLANVYASMAPNEAAPLIGKLDEETALSLLKKMPSKRMGQILSGMEPDRAVRLTKILSERASTEDIPAQ